MGCWNGTCAISKLPIHYGDDVICWFINTPLYSDDKGADASNFCYPHDRYELLGVPFRAQYNDYGSFEDVHADDEPMLNIIINMMRDNLVEIDQGDNQYHDIEVKKANLDLELIKEAMHEGRLYIKGWGDKKCAVGLMMVHEHLLEEMIRTYTWTDYEHNPDTDRYERVKKQMSVESIIAKISKAAEKDMSSKFGFEREMRRYLERVTFVSSINQEFSFNQVPTHHPMYQQFIRGLAYNHVLDSFAHVLRLSYGPQSGSGSQGNDQEPYHALIGAMQSVMKKANARFGDDEEEDEE
jgi:hypothetical protein